MTVTHVGSTKKYSEGWASIFRGKKAATSVAEPAPKKKSAAKKKPKR